MPEMVAKFSRITHHRPPRPWKVALVLFLLLTLAGNLCDTFHDHRHPFWTWPSSAVAEYGDEEPTFFQAAGPCARCHVVSVVEWGISGHFHAQTNCQSCHGSSDDHIANERNEIKPDCIVRGEAIARQLCSRCHVAGCPSTQRTQSCQTCHHVHALLDPTKRPATALRENQEQVARLHAYHRQMAEAKTHFARKQWTRAKVFFQRALELMPGDRSASAGALACQRRLHPMLAGFDSVGEAYDQATGLPQDVTIEGLDLPMRLVPPGSYEMGSEAWPDSQPVHTVRVRAFFLGRTEVTQNQWQAVMGSNPAAHQGEAYPDAASMPVERVSWHDALAFIERLNHRVAGGGFRLPRETEWEYACRAGSTQFDPSEALAQAWCSTSTRQKDATPDAVVTLEVLSTRPVALRRSNAWGFFDMQGNVAEWCTDHWRAYVSPSIAPKSTTTLRVLRGGSYADTVRAMDPALRHAARSQHRLRFYGLRLARDVPNLEPRDLD